MPANSESQKPLIANTVHWWSEPGSLQAVQVLDLALAGMGVKFVDDVNDNFSDLRKNVIKQMALGYSPTLVQWHAGREVKDFSNLGKLGEIDDPGLRQYLKSDTYGFVYDSIIYHDRMIAIPMNLHGENWLWINKSVYDKLGLSPPDTWEKLLQQAEIIRASGVPPLALGSEGFELRILFNSILLGHGGRDIYNQLYSTDSLNSRAREKLVEVLAIFLKLRDLQSGFKRQGNWYAATKNLAAGEAAMQFMGDWAKAELMADGLVPGEDFYCRMAPGTENYYIYVLDMFLLGRVTT